MTSLLPHYRKYKRNSGRNKDIVSQFLENRGLTLSEEKTMITHIDGGFDFLGWTFRKFRGKLIVKPSKNSIKTLIRKCSTIILKEGKATSQSELIRRLNQIIRGWTNYHRHVVASQTFPTSTTHFITYCINGQDTGTPIKINGGD
jgi:RNA-directed DNA polymerase